MCRNHLPGWQDSWEARSDRDDLMFVAVAMDAQGWDRAQPYVEKAKISFPAVVDREGLLWEELDFDFVPLQILFDEQGREVLRTRGAPDEALLARLDEAFEVPPPPTGRGSSRIGGPVDPAAAAEAQKLFARGVSALESGNRKEAVRLWSTGLEKDPGNWLIRKQIWALENPDRFYGDEIDTQWQRGQLQQRDR